MVSMAACDDLSSHGQMDQSEHGSSSDVSLHVCMASRP